MYSFYENKVAGFIITPSPGIKNEIKMLIENNVPLILFDRYFDDLETNYVVMDNLCAGYNATQHLLKNNFKKIGLVTIESCQNQMTDREMGYIKAMEEINLKSKVFRIPYKEVKAIDQKINLQDFLEGKEKLDAVLFSTFYLTTMALPIIDLNKLAVVTFDDHEIFKFYSPPITAIKQPSTEFAIELMSIMADLLEKNRRNLGYKKVVLKSTLRIRDSSG